MYKPAFTHIAICAAALSLAAAQCAQASPVAGDSAVPAASLSSFHSMYGTPIVTSSDELPAAPAESAPPTVRLRVVEQLAAGHGLTWEKVYHVSPASALKPVTTLERAMRMVDQTGTVSLSVTHTAATSVIRTVAGADNATVDLSPALALGPIDAQLSDDTVAQAIAALAQRTHTHWAAEYVLAPAVPEQVIYSRPSHTRQMMTEAEFEASPYFDGPITVHVAPPAPAPVAPASTVAAAAEQGASDQAAKDVAAAAAANPAVNPAVNPYAYLNGYYDAPQQPYVVSPGLIVQPGNPWDQPTYVFGQTTVHSF